MCNRIVQNGVVVRPGEPVMVIMRGPGGDWLMPQPAIWGGSARGDKRRYWLKAMRGEEVLIPKVSKWGEVDKSKDEWEDLPPGAALRGILLPEQKDKKMVVYRLLKVVTSAATGAQLGRFEKDRAVEVESDAPEVQLPAREPPAQGQLF